jgi:hypothetical protein
MLSRKLMDWMSLLVVLAAVFSLFTLFRFGWLLAYGAGASLDLFIIVGWIANIIEGIYGILVLILAIQLYSVEKLKIFSIVLVIIFLPLAIIYYLFTYRKILKEYESNQSPLQQNNLQY